ncbi:hypothetical protein JCM10213v2_000945 [Rhodosporidiobolus nylandii]
MSTSLKDLSSSPGFSSMPMSLGRSFEERPKIEAQFFKNFTCCGLDLQDLHGLLEHFEECHVAFDDDSATDGGMDLEGEGAESEGTISGPPSPRLLAAGQLPGRGGAYETKKSHLSSFETPDSPATQALHLDSGMELDMEMGDDEGAAVDHSSPSSVGSSGSSHLPSSQNGFAGQPTMSHFGNPLPLHGGASKKQKQQQQQAAAASGIPPTSTTVPTSLFDGVSRATSSQPGTPAAEDPANPMDTFLPAGTVNPVSALGGTAPPIPHAGIGVSGGLAPSLLFPPSGRSSQSPPAGAASNHLQMPSSEEPEEEEESESDEDSTDDENEDLEKPFAHYNGGAAMPQHGLPSFLPPSSLPPLAPELLPAVPRSHHGNHHPKPPSKQKASPVAPHLAPLPQHLPIINPHDPNTIAALAATTLKDPMATAAAIAALGPNSLAALPTALHPLGQGVQISPSGRPYTPPSEKPFKCTVPGCDKAYKQQNGLKYHRLHGHCGANAMKGGDDPRSEGKPYVCHVASCGKRYKNMNGLRYHYQHSGAHGALGLQMLAQGCHPPPQFPPGHKRGTIHGHHQLAQSYTAHSSSTSSRAGSPHAHHYGRGVDAGQLNAALGGRY